MRKPWFVRVAPVVLAATMAVAFDAGAAYVLLPNGTRIDGKSIRAKRNGEVTIETDAGSRTFAAGQYSKAVADQPPEIAQAQAQIKAQQYDAALPLLEKVVAEYQYLEWDQQALKLLPQVYARKGDYQAAVAAYEKFLGAAAEPDSEAQFGYFEALLKTQQYDKLEPKLKEMIAKGTREEAARAQTLRGDIRVAQNQLENALLDYLRTALLFEAQKESHPEALFKAAETLEKLRDARAKDLYRKLVEEYPSSPYAAQAQAKM